MMLKQSKNADPMRISQESLDLDDIISDLNSEKASSQQPLAAAVAQQKQNKSTKQQVATVRSKVMGKENDGVNANKASALSVVGKQMQEATEKSVMMAETKGSMMGGGHATNEKNTAITFSEIHSSQANNRYGESNAKSEANHHTVEDERVPFYIKSGPVQMQVGDEDVESFQRKLDTLIVNFRSETMSEFMKTKKQVLHDQASTIDAERRRCNTLLGVKQNEIEQLKEGLANKTKLSEDLNTRCEGMAFWAGKAKMMLRIKLLQFKAFDGLRKYRDFQKHSKRVLEHRLRQYREDTKRKVFQGWGLQYKAWKVKKNREDFEKAVKLELQHICAQYNKEIEGLREKLGEAQAIVDSEHRHKAMMQENLKKAFMRGVCALNFEAMNILHPNDQSQLIEKEMEKQVLSAMNSVAQQSPFTYDTSSQIRQGGMIPRPPIFQSASEHQMSPSSTTSFEQEPAYQERKMMNAVDSAANVNPFSQNIVEHLRQPEDFSKKIETKDSLWKPAPIMGREINQQVIPTFTYQQQSITSQLKSPHTSNATVLSSHFSKQQVTYNTDLVGVMTKTVQEMPQITRIEEDTQGRAIPGNHAVISSSLPDFVTNGHGATQGEGKTIIASQTMGKTIGGAAKGQTAVAKRPGTAVVGSAVSKKK